jgi:hypothetical protein
MRVIFEIDTDHPQHAALTANGQLIPFQNRQLISQSDPNNDYNYTTQWTTEGRTWEVTLSRAAIHGEH